MVACPCCKNLTLQNRAMYEICPVCWWEDDGQDDRDADEVYGGPNYISLTQARANYLAFGACKESHKHLARAPGKHERPKLPPGHARQAARHAR